MITFVITMTIDEFISRVEQQMGFSPTADQHRAVTEIARFLAFRHDHAVMVMRGSAGTGKTTLTAALVRTLASLRQKMVLLAPTGRAAKVLSHDDLITYVYGGRNCRLMLIGDTAQLPPVGEEESPALAAEVLQGYGLSVFQADLDEVVRQAGESGILYNATMIRTMITHDAMTQLPRIRLQGFADVSVVPGNELIEALSQSYHHVGVDDTIVVTRSNKTARIYNLGIRSTILDRGDDLLSSGDRLMIVKNHYLSPASVQGEDRPPFAFIANGDCCRVVKVRRQREMHGLNFADVWLQFPDYDNYEYQSTVVLDSLSTDAPALTREQSDQLYQRVLDDYADLPRKADRMAAMRQDPYFTALQIKFAYAVTCHKAQGGQWAHVYIDQGYMTDDMLTPDYIHWLYTAFTRARERLFLVNWREGQIEG